MDAKVKHNFMTKNMVIKYNSPTAGWETEKNFGEMNIALKNEGEDAKQYRIVIETNNRDDAANKPKWPGVKIYSNSTTVSIKQDPEGNCTISSSGKGFYSVTITDPTPGRIQFYVKLKGKRPVKNRDLATVSIGENVPFSIKKRRRYQLVKMSLWRQKTKI
ncbi:MAG: hypothetical protein GY757_37525 [bacterium]|nr:hypothetical protein [bacterium]